MAAQKAWYSLVLDLIILGVWRLFKKLRAQKKHGTKKQHSDIARFFSENTGFTPEKAILAIIGKKRAGSVVPGHEILSVRFCSERRYCNGYIGYRQTELSVKLP